MSPESIPAPSRAAEPDALADEVYACLAAFPILVEQIREVARVVESAVVAVCSSFQSMARRAEGALGASQAAVQEAGNGSLIEDAGTAIEGLLGRLDDAARISGENIARTRSTIHATIDAMDRQLKEIDRVSGALHILALNSKIEASRAGAAGTGFMVVASETGTLAREAIRCTGDIRKLFDGLRDIARERRHDDAQGTPHRGRRLADQIRQGRSDTALILTRLRTAQGLLCAQMEGVSRENRGLATDIANAVQALQFQDAVNQRLTHVAGAIEEMAAALLERAEGSAPAPPTDWVTRLQRGYTMHAERQVQGRASGASLEDDLGANITLF